MKENPLGYENVSALLRKFALPSIAAMLVGSLYNIVDQIFIGQGIGYLGNAATNVSYPLSTICLGISLLIGIGSGARFSILLGENRPDRAASLVGNGIILMVVAGLLYLLLGELFLEPLLRIFGTTDEVMPLARQYAGITLAGMPFLILTNGLGNIIRADGSPAYSMLCMVAGAVINTILDPICIFLFQWGIAGAAVATVAGQGISFLIALRYLWKFKTIRLTRSCFSLDLPDCLRTLYMGTSSCINQMAITVVQIVLNNSLTHYGALSAYGKDIPLAACGIVMKTNAILLSIIVGISQGAQPIIGYNFGAKRYQRVRQAYLLAITWNLVISAAAFCLFQFFPRRIISLFGSGEPLYFTFSVLFMRVFLFMTIINGVQVLSSSFFTAIGKAMKGLLLSLTRQVFFLIPLLLLLPLRFGIMGILVAGPIADFIAFLVSAALVHAQFSQFSRTQA